MTIDKRSENSQKWLEAAKILGVDPTAKVLCPECSIGHLMVKDELIENWSKLDRYLICDHCRRWNVMTMAIPDNYDRINPIDTTKNK